MGCDSNEPEQRGYETFWAALIGPPGRLGALWTAWEPDGCGPSVRFLSMWAKANGFVDCASRTKRLLVCLTKGPASHLIRAFGHAFSGDEVGALGRDILEFGLRQSSSETRGVSVEVLGRWLDDDEDGAWLDMANDHIDREEDDELKARCQRLVRERLDEEEVVEDLMGCLVGTPSWPDMERALDVVRAGARRSRRRGRETRGTAPPEREEYLAVGRSRPNRVRAELETKALPSFLEKVVGVDTSITLGVLESLQVGRLVIENVTLGFSITPVDGGWQVRTWALNGAFSFSIEPTATEGTWLVFTRF